MVAEDGLKAQKLLAQGSALGIEAINKSPCKGKSFINYLIFKAFALTGRLVCVRIYPGCYPGLGASALSGREGHPVISGHGHFRSFSFSYALPPREKSNRCIGG